jgi:UDP-GlcNAc:undecaprenyl-phosphate GlcNAc-1-phosphate transferase
MPAAIAFVVSVALMPLAIRLGRATGLVDRPGPDGLKIHPTPVPVLGGPAAVVAIAAGLASAGDVRWWFLAGVLLAMVVGLIDDARTLPPWPRVAAIAVAGAIAAPALTLSGPTTVLLGAFLALCCANGVNIIDGQDGLAGGLCLLAASSMGLSAEALAVSDGLPIGLATAGALAGFLLWNRPPARLFLGNGGAYALGILLATQAAVLVETGPRGFVATALCLAPFAFELIFTTARRLRHRSSLVRGDRSHSYDLLAASLGSRGRATLVLWAVAGICGILGIASAAASLEASLAIAAVAGVAAATLVVIALRAVRTSTSTA